MEIDDEIAELVKIRDYATRRIRELKSFQRPSVPVPSPNKHLWVQTNCISPHVRRELEKGETIVGLARRAGVSTRVVGNIRDDYSEWTREDIADKLMMAMDLPHIHLEPVRVRHVVPEPPPSQYYED